MPAILNERRVVGATVEGFGEYATRWNNFHYKCPDCRRWGRLGDVSFTTPAGDDFLCEDCSGRFLRDEAAAEAEGLAATA